MIYILPLERRQRILELLQHKKNIKISELSNELNVSEMTIHRDLKPLIEQNMLFKTFGGICINQNNNDNLHIKEINNDCIICKRSIHDRLCYRLILKNDVTEQTCCSHCGLIRHRQIKNEVVQAIIPDFLKHTTISATVAYYVFDTTLDIGCCYPQVLPFESLQHATQFVKGFGGEIYSFQEAIERIQNPETKVNCCKKSPHQD